MRAPILRLAALIGLLAPAMASAQAPQPPAHTVALPALPRVSTIAPTDYLLGISGATGTPGTGQVRLMPVPALPATVAVGGLSDVILSSPTTGQALAYNAGTGKWVNTTVTSPPGGSSGQLQYNSSGSFAGMTSMNGDCSLNTGTGAITCTKTSGSSFAAIATSGSASDLGAGTVPPPRLPAASTVALGAVKVGSGLTVAGDGTLSSSSTGAAFDSRQDFTFTGSPGSGCATVLTAYRSDLPITLNAGSVYRITARFRRNGYSGLILGNGSNGYLAYSDYSSNSFSYWTSIGGSNSQVQITNAPMTTDGYVTMTLQVTVDNGAQTIGMQMSGGIGITHEGDGGHMPLATGTWYVCVMGVSAPSDIKGVVAVENPAL